MFNDTLFFEKKNSLVDIIQQEKLVELFNNFLNEKRNNCNSYEIR